MNLSIESIKIGSKPSKKLFRLIRAMKRGDIILGKNVAKQPKMIPTTAIVFAKDDSIFNKNRKH